MKEQDLYTIRSSGERWAVDLNEETLGGIVNLTG
jgi:hypothetical protein